MTPHARRCVQLADDDAAARDNDTISGFDTFNGNFQKALPATPRREKKINERPARRSEYLRIYLRL